LIHHAVAVPELESFVKTLCDDLAANAPLSMRHSKRIIRAVSATSWDVAQSKAWVRECFESEDYKEGRKAFMEKRKPVFKGK
jgi:enoyl-CoA hydratase